MNPETVLLSALHADPFDETAWLALGDCLEEQGRPDRAELLRLHRSLRLREDGPERWALERRVRSLLAAGVAPCVPRLVNSAGMELALIPAGVFHMGSAENEEDRCEDEGPRHKVEIGRPFYLGITPVTQGQYRQVMGRNPSYHSLGGGGKDLVRGLATRSFPVDSVTWTEAVTFCQTLASRPVEHGRTYRLPTEAEWEYACRAWAASAVPFHYGLRLPPTLANVLERGADGALASSRSLGRTTVVGSYPPNAFGLHDMHGNVWEWCSDWFDRSAYYSSALRDPQGPLTGNSRVLRGGSFNFEAWLARSACRVCYDAEHRATHDGFRVVMVPEGWG
jgi:uncharacterized protein (TIGR02996 family)